MMEYKAMTTPMASNLKLLSDASSELVDAMNVSLDDWVLDVLEEYKRRYFHCCEHIEPFSDKSKTCSPDCYKAYFEGPKGYS